LKALNRKETHMISERYRVDVFASKTGLLVQVYKLATMERTTDNLGPTQAANLVRDYFLGQFSGMMRDVVPHHALECELDPELPWE
jgi:hypothetical protein